MGGTRDERATSPAELARLTAPPVPPAGRVAIVLRLIVAVALIVGWAQLATQPAERSVSDLLTALHAGRVESVTMERPREGAEAQGQFRVEWSGDGRPGYAYYEYSSFEGGEPVDEGQWIRAAAEQSPSPVSVSTQYGYLGPTGTTWYLAGIAVFAALLLLVGGPQPRLATKWAWFWLAASIPPLWLVLMVLEPVPLWWRTPMAPARRRLTGGWAFLLSFPAEALVLTVVPGYAGLFS